MPMGQHHDEGGNDDVTAVGEVHLVLHHVAHAHGGDHAVEHHGHAAHGSGGHGGHQGRKLGEKENRIARPAAMRMTRGS